MKPSFLFFFLTIIFALALCSCDREEPSTPNTTYQELIGSEGTIGSAGGSLTVVDQYSPINGAGIFIPEGAVVDPVQLTISQVKDDTIQGFEDAVIIEFGPSGQTFNLPVEIVLPYEGNYERIKLFYVDRESEQLTQVELKYHDVQGKKARAMVSHFSTYVVTDYHYAWFDADLYSTDSCIKAKICIQGNAYGLEGLAGIPIKRLWHMITSQFRVLNVSQMIEVGVPMYGLQELTLFCTIKVSLMEGRWYASRILDEKTIALERVGKDLETSRVRISYAGGGGTLYNTGPLDKEGREAYFSGKNLVFNFDTPPEEGKNYYLKMSYCFSDNSLANRVWGSRYTQLYEVNTYEEKDPWTLDRMIKEDPDTNGNFVDDAPEGLIKELTVTSRQPYNITNTSVTSGGWIRKPPTVVLKEWGLCYDQDYHNPTINQEKVISGGSEDDFTLNVGGLEKGTTYYIRAYAITDDHEVQYGETFEFRTTYVSINKPSVVSYPAGSIGLAQSTIRGEVLADGGAEITQRGFFWGRLPEPANTGQHVSMGSGIGSFSTILRNLDNDATYYYVAYASNSEGTAFSEERSFTTSEIILETGTVEDYEGNIYATVKIGSQWWMAENLKSTVYNDGTPVAKVEDAGEWIELSTPAYCWYDNDISKKDDYGALYNWHIGQVALNGGKNICPSGWKVPLLEDWNALEKYLIENGYNYDASTEYDLLAKAMSSASGWSLSAVEGAPGNIDYPGVSNASAFSALPGGRRKFDSGTFIGMGDLGAWWTGEITLINAAATRSISAHLPWVEDGLWDIHNGLSIRCVKE